MLSKFAHVSVKIYFRFCGIRYIYFFWLLCFRPFVSFVSAFFHPLSLSHSSILPGCMCFFFLQFCSSNNLVSNFIRYIKISRYSKLIGTFFITFHRMKRERGKKSAKNEYFDFYAIIFPAVTINHVLA